MTDLAIEPKRQADVTAESRSSVPAIVTYWLLGLWTVIVAAVIAMVLLKLELSSIMLAVLTGLIGTTNTLLVAAVSFWVGATQGGKQANERLSEASKLSNAALERAVGSVMPAPAPGEAVIRTAPDVDVAIRDASAPDDDGEIPPDQRVTL